MKIKKQDIIAQNSLSTVVAEYEPLLRRAKNYQSEEEFVKEVVNFSKKLINDR